MRGKEEIVATKKAADFGKVLCWMVWMVWMGLVRVES